MTASLELSTNQVTHFYSEKKNTAEMIKLLDVLLIQYANCDKIYFSGSSAKRVGNFGPLAAFKPFVSRMI